MLFKPLTGAIVALALLAPPSANAAAQASPKVSASSAVLVDAGDGHVLYSADSGTRSQIASTTKLMTALIALEKLPLDKVLVAPDYKPGSSGESLANLRPGERMKVDDLLRALLLESANDAAVTLARGAGGSQARFVKLMNRKARAMKLRNTHYENPIGLDSTDNYSTARDLARLTRRLLRNGFFAATVRMPTARLLSGAYPRTIENRNDLVGKYPFVTGVKTGHTERADYVLVGSGTQRATRLVSVVLGTPSESARDADTLALLGYGFSLYRQVTPVRAGATAATARISFYGDRKAPLTGARNVTMSVRRGQRVTTSIDAPDELDGPIGKGERVGTITVRVAGKRARSVPLVTVETVPGAGILRKAAHYLLRWPVLLAIAVAGLVLFERRRRRRAAAESARRRRRQAARLD